MTDCRESRGDKISSGHSHKKTEEKKGRFRTMGEKIAYIRVSTIDQDTLRQDKMMQDLGITEDNTFREKISGKNADRPELQRMLQYIRKGDTIYIESLSRLGRNTQDLLDIVEEIHKKGADFVSLKETIDTSTATGKFILTVFAALAELERQNILQRQREGIEAKKEKDRKRKEQGLPAETYKGRARAKYDPEQLKRELFLVQEGKQTHDQAAQHLGLQIRTYYRRVKELQEQEEQKGQTITVNGKYNPPVIDESKMTTLKLEKHEEPEQKKEWKPVKITQK